MRLNLTTTVLAQLRARDLASRALFASDGSQLLGFVGSDLSRQVTGMQDADFSTQEIADVLAGNFYALYFSRS